MNVEELMRKMVKVIADYPNSPYEIGDIFIDTGRPAYWQIGENYVWEYTLDRYPHLFAPIPWYADRAVEDMPEYVRGITPDTLNGVFKVKHHVPNEAAFVYTDFNSGTYLNYAKIEPATETDYLTYKNKV